MRGTSWTVVVMIIGLLGAGIALLAQMAMLPRVFANLAVILVPLLTLGAAFVGTMSTGAFVVGSLVAIVALTAPIADVTAASLAAGNFDDASGYGIATGLAIAITGAVAFAFAARRRSLSSVSYASFARGATTRTTTG